MCLLHVSNWGLTLALQVLTARVQVGFNPLSVVDRFLFACVILNILLPPLRKSVLFVSLSVSQ